jgi:hypothetical protein
MRDNYVKQYSVYCTSKGNPADEYIDYVSIGGINNTTLVMLDMVTLLALWVIFLMVQNKTQFSLVLARYSLYRILKKPGLTIIKWNFETSEEIVTGSLVVC